MCDKRPLGDTPPRSASDAGWRPSRYNIGARIPDDPQGRIAVVNLLRDTVAAYAPLELAPIGMLDELPETHPAIAMLARRGLIVNFDELAGMEMLGRTACAGDSRVCLTICPTMGCNFDCPYCFEDHRAGKMSAEVQDDVVALAKRLVDACAPKVLYVSWYGGEPLLAPDIIENLSERLIRLAEESGATYVAKAISNGYLLSPDVCAMLERARVGELQVTLDGLGAAHDATRHLANGRPTFERIVENLTRPGLPFLVKVRNNVHANNLDEVDELRLFVERMAAESGNDLRYYPSLVFQNERSRRRGSEVAFATEECAARVLLEQAEPVKGMRPLPCGAGNLWEVGIDPSGRLYKCWEVVDKPEYSFGTAHDWDPANPLYTASDPDVLVRYVNGSAPQKYEECMRCLWLPLCAGGCPNVQLDGSRSPCLPFKDMPEEYALARLRWAHAT